MTEKKEALSLLKTVVFSSKGDNFEIMGFAKESGYEARAKKNGQLLPWVYSMDYDVALDYPRPMGESVCDSWINMLLSAILNKTHEPG